MTPRRASVRVAKRFTALAVLCAASALTALSATAKTRTMFFFDAEDYTNPRSWDALRDLSTLFHEEGATVHVALVGYLAHQLEANGRKDVLDALKPHLVGTQSAYHSRHPNVMELSDGKDFAAAYDRVFREESEGIRWIERATGKKVGFAVPPGTSKSYVAMYAYADMGIRFYCDTTLGGEQGGAWYGLGVRQCPYTVSMEFLLPSEGKDLRDADIAEQLDRAAKEDVAIFYLHPCLAVCRQFWDALNYNCTNAVEFGKWKLSEPRPAADTKLYRSRLRQLVRRLRADGRFDFVTLDDLAKAERPRVAIRPADMPRISAHLEKNGLRPMDEPSWSVADLFQAAVRFLDGAPEHVPGRTFGFLEKPYVVSSPVILSAADLRAAAKDIDLKAFLPSSMTVGGVKVGPGDFLRAAAAVLADSAEKVKVTPSDPLIEVQNHPDLKDFHAVGTWVFTPDYKDEYTTDRLRWQIWTARREPIDRN